MHLEEILRRYHVDLSSLSLPEYQRGGKEHLIYLLRVPVTHVLAQWEELRTLTAETGYWPVIGWDRFKSPPKEDDSVQDILEEGLHVDIQKWLEQEGSSANIDKEKEALHANDPYSPFVFRLHLRRFSFTLPLLAPTALIPTSDSWEVPAYLPVQANEWDPPLAVHVAMMKYWNERWGAELVAMVPGIVEMRVLQPPKSLDEALALAMEQYIYCPDLTDQQVGSIQRLAKILINGHVWQFWWD
jgi:Domain of unknown function (DUF4253)